MGFSVNMEREWEEAVRMSASWVGVGVDRMTPWRGVAC
jgi:hypothetical protein